LKKICLVIYEHTLLLYMLKSTIYVTEIDKIKLNIVIFLRIPEKDFMSDTRTLSEMCIFNIEHRKKPY